MKMGSMTDQNANGLAVSVACLTDTGRVRSANEDAFVVAELLESEVKAINGDLDDHRVGPDGLLLAVSDGMGGAQAGEVASRLAIELVIRRLSEPAQNGSVTERLSDALKLANRAIWHASRETPAFSGMGATMTAALIYQGQAYLGQVGDSRCYLIHEGLVQQVTKDQSLVQVLVDIGQMTKEQAVQSPQRNVVLQSLGVRDEIEPALSVVTLTHDDYLILTSDYLMQKVTDSEMCEIIKQAPTLSGACAQLVALANERGGDDNITVIVARFSVANPGVVRQDPHTEIT
jgi:serine/threonine protein phosphatase PrpC